MKRIWYALCLGMMVSVLSSRYEPELRPFLVDECCMSLKDQAHIGILLQVAEDSEPVVLAKVLHSKMYVTQASAQEITVSDDEEEDEEEVKEGNDDTDGAVKPNNRNGKEEQESANEDGADRRSILAAPKAKKGKVSDIPQGPSLRKKWVGNDAAVPSKDPKAAKLKNKKHNKRAQDK